jgi:tRNA-(ms[2]io[6]A)-hydroxylase
LTKAVRGHEPERLLDTLLVAAIIEARSCERFKLLAAAVDDPTLAKLYSGLLACEARHHHTYFDLAARAGGEPAARDRLRELAALEAEILSSPVASVRMHS